MKKKMLGMSDAWLTIHLSHRPSEPAYYIVGFQARVRPARASAIEPLFSDCSLETRRPPPPPPLGAAIFSALGREEETIQRWYMYVLTRPKVVHAWQRYFSMCCCKPTSLQSKAARFCCCFCCYADRREEGRLPG